MLPKEELLQSRIFDFLIYPVDDGTELHQRGENKQNICISVFGPPSPDWIEFLEKIMASIQVDLAKDALVVFPAPDQPYGFSSLAKRESIRTALFFGPSPKNAGLQFDAPPYTPFALDGRLYLFCDTLADIQADQQKKRRLWQALKDIATWIKSPVQQ